MSAITLDKIMKVLTTVTEMGVSKNSLLYSNSTGELRLDFTSQPEKELHEYLLNKGFVLVETVYIYRPRLRKRG